MISISLDPKDHHVLRVTASYLLALAASPETSAAEGLNQVASIHNDLVEASTFNPAELAEAEKYAQPPVVREPDNAFDPFPPAPPLTPAEVFAAAGKSALSIVAAGPSPIVLADTPGIISIPTPPGVPLPPVPSAADTVSHVAPNTANHVSGVEVDARGLPWDARIHSREKTKIANGNWKNKRGVEDQVLANVEAELKGLMAIPTPPPLDHAPAAIVPPSTPAVVAPPVSTAPTANPSDFPFPALMQKVSGWIAAGRISQAQVMQACQARGLAAIPLLIQRPDMIPQIDADLSALVGE